MSKSRHPPLAPTKLIFSSNGIFRKMQIYMSQKVYFSPQDLYFHQKINWDDRTGIFLNFCIFAKNHDFFVEIMIFWKSLKIRFFWLQSPKKLSKINFFDSEIIFLKNIVLQLQNGIFTSVVPPLLLPREFFEPLMYTFKDTKSAPKKKYYSFGEGFWWNPSTSAISTALWSWLIFRIFRSIFETGQKVVTLGFGICR